MDSLQRAWRSGKIGAKVSVQPVAKSARFRSPLARPTLIRYPSMRNSAPRLSKVIDTVDRKRRSEIMGRVRHKDTKPEMIVRRITHGLGFRYRLHSGKLPGRPDLVFPARKKVIFVHGCFWHRHAGCARTRTPKSRVEFWNKKFDENVRRDKSARKKLADEGWEVLIIWECETDNPSELAERIVHFLSS